MNSRPRLEVNLNLLHGNIEKLKKITHNCKILFMVKADGYGHGISEIVEHSYEKSGIRHFGVAQLEEAIKLRKSVSFSDYDIFVFSDLSFDSRASDGYFERRITPVISNEKTLDFFLKNDQFKYVPLVLFFNIGMNRLGLEFNRIETILEKLHKYGRKSIDHLMGHFSCSGEDSNKSKAQTIPQLKVFAKIKTLIKKSNIEIVDTSVSNSGAIIQNIGLDESFVRPGIMLYSNAFSPTEEYRDSVWHGKNISSLKLQIIDFKKVKAGDKIGYGATPIKEDGVIVHLNGGYGDGLLAQYSGSNIFHLGHKGFIIGRVNMDILSLFFPGPIFNKLDYGQEITIWDEEYEGLHGLSKSSQMSVYQILCSIGRRIPRVYHLK